ncbi:MAG: hypothetical protein ACI8QD_000744 [Cyclobacteriaceae bacterium]|jgi:hypothetical protein
MIWLFTSLFQWTLLFIQPEYPYELSLNFEKIDNQVNILVDDTLVYTSGVIDDNPELELSVDLKQYISANSKAFTIQLINGDPENPYMEDLHWEIRFEVMKDNQPVDFVWEFADDAETGEVLSLTYQLNQL